MLGGDEAEFVLDKDEFSKTIGKEIEVYGTAEPTSGTQAKFEIKAKKVLVVGKI